MVETDTVYGFVVLEKRWVKEYLPSLQSRQKWKRSHRNMRKNDLVLVVDQNLPRGQWTLAIVREVNVSRDGHVRSCLVKYGRSLVVRPITSLCLLEASD